MPPIRLYLLSSFVMFLTLSQAGVEVQNMTVTVGGTPVEVDSAALSPDRPEPRESPDSSPEAPDTVSAEFEASGFADEDVEELIAGRISRGLRQISDDPESFSQLFFSRMEQAMFFLLPAFALLLKSVYRGRPYLHHGIFSIYLHCFVFSVVTVSTIPDVLGLSALASIADVLLIVIPVYLLLAMKRFYAEGWIRTTVKAWAVLVAYGVMGGMMMVGLLMVSLLTM